MSPILMYPTSSYRRRTPWGSCKPLTVLFWLAGTSLAVGCSNGGGGSSQSAVGDTVVERRLSSFDDSEGFYDALREALRKQWSGSTDFGFASQEEDSAAIDGSDDSEVASAGEPAGEAAADLADTLADSDITGTNVQEIGVDEADRIKTDGDFLYVLDSRRSDYFPFVESTPDAEALETAPRTSWPAPVQAETILRILSMQPDAPDATPVSELTIDLEQRQASGMYLYSDASERSLFVMSNGAGGFWDYWSEPLAFGEIDALVSKVDVTDPANAREVLHLRIDGQIISSRRIGGYLFVASRYYPAIPELNPYGMTEADWNSAVDAVELSTLLPEYALDDGASRSLIDPRGCFVASRNDSDPWYTPDIITLAVFDLDTLELSDSECYLGATETLYASPQAVYLATTRWQYSRFPTGFDDVVDELWFVDPRVDTDIHQFSIDGGQLVYTGTGTVSGHLGWNEERKPWRMSEQDGFLRVATFSARQAADTSPVRLTVLQPDGDGRLVSVSALPNSRQPAFIGKPGEQLYASRFVGDRAYLVTFRQTDPLYVIDLADPLNPKLAGELEIDGYSDYLQPVGVDHLLGIGRDAVAVFDGVGDGRGAVTLGVKLSLIDVSDPESPREVQALTIGQRGTEAQALYNHRAITVQRATGEHPTRITFGIEVAGRPDPVGTPTGDEAFRYYSWNYTGLHGFEVRTGADARITSVNPLIVARAANGDFRLGSYLSDDRSIITGDSVYYVHGADVYAAPFYTMDNSVGPR